MASSSTDRAGALSLWPSAVAARLYAVSSPRPPSTRCLSILWQSFVGFVIFFTILGSRSSPHVDGSGSEGSGAARVRPAGEATASGGAQQQQQQQRRRPQLFGFRILREYPHDPRAFTQGLEFDRHCDKKGGGEQQRRACREVLWESTGLNGRSSVREVDLASGRVLRSKSLPQQDFGEGLTRLGDRCAPPPQRQPAPHRRRRCRRDGPRSRVRRPAAAAAQFPCPWPNSCAPVSPSRPPAGCIS